MTRILIKCVILPRGARTSQNPLDMSNPVQPMRVDVCPCCVRVSEAAQLLCQQVLQDGNRLAILCLHL